MLLSALINYPLLATTKMPFLEIVHRIPNRKHYWAEIRNADAEGRELAKKIHLLTTDIEN
jgi:predicted transcriptional regulator YheO